MARPWLVMGLVTLIGFVGGASTIAAMAARTQATLHARLAMRDAQLTRVQHDAQTQINALAIRLGQLQAQANRLNALGERLTQLGKLTDGEFNFETPEGEGGTEEPTVRIAAHDLQSSLGQLEQNFAHSGQQLDVLSQLLFDHQLEQNAVPSRAPIDTYITSGFGLRVDPFTGGYGFHKGVDFHANIGDPVTAVADGVVSYVGPRGGYGKLIEIDHGNGYVTRYAHNSVLIVHTGDLVHAGQTIAKAGSTGHSTGAHVHFEVWKNGKVMNPVRFLGQFRSPVIRR